MSSIETRRQEAWDKAPAELIDEIERRRMACAEAMEPYGKISERVHLLVINDELDHTNMAQKAMFIEMDALYEPVKRTMDAHLAAVKACWDAVGGEPI
jgi:hypothetical protein